MLLIYDDESHCRFLSERLDEVGAA